MMSASASPENKRFPKTHIFLLLLSLIAITAAIFLFLREPVRQALAPDASIPPGNSSEPDISFSVVDTGQREAKYVFIMIGDGMGGAQRDLAQSYAEYCGEKTPLVMNSLPASGMVTTNSLSGITDSAAAATAYAAGCKTNNGMLSMTPEGEELKTIFGEAEEKGLSTGLVTTSRITDATPAAFAAHAKSRTLEADIALDYLDSGVDFFAGGGVSYFLPISYSAGGIDAAGLPMKSLRGDEKDVAAGFIDAGYETFIGLQGAKDFADFVPSPGDKVFASFTNGYMPFELDRKEESLQSPTLAEMTDKAISVLGSDEDGFVLMIEGGRTDHACKANDPAGTIFETLEFNKAVQEAYGFYKRHPDETLVIVVGDHETGGLKIGEDVDLSHVKGLRSSITERINSFYTGDRDAFYRYLSQNFGLWDLNPGEKARIEDALDAADSKDYKGGYEGSPASAVSAILSKRIGVSWAGPGHTGVPVPLYAAGLYAENFSGNIDNTDIGRLLFELICN